MTLLRSLRNIRKGDHILTVCHPELFVQLIEVEMYRFSVTHISEESTKTEFQSLKEKGKGRCEK